MPRNKKISTEELLSLIDNYFLTMHKDITSLKYSKISLYLKKQGHKVEEYDIRRNVEVVNHLSNLRSSEENIIFNNIVVFKNIDVDDFLIKNNSISELKKALTNRDNYYEKVCSSATIIIEQNKELKEKNIKISKENEQLRQENDLLIHQLKNEKKKNRELCISVKLLKNLMKTNVYPEIANELLRENGLLEGGEDIISEEGKEKILSDTDSIINTIKNTEKMKSQNTIIQGLFDKI